MGVAELIEWQWRGYQDFHASRQNLLIHIVAVPVFLLANVILVAALLKGAWAGAGVALVCMLVSFGLQGIGHGREANPSIPFSGPANALARIFLEQWVNFPRFVLSGGWFRALRDAR